MRLHTDPRHNEAHSVNSPIATLFHIAHHRQRATDARRSLKVKGLAMLILFCLSAVAAVASDVQVVAFTTTNAASSSVTTVEVFTRSGQTNLVRQTKVGEGGINVRLQQFYHDGVLVGEFGGASNNRAFATTVGTPYQVTFGFGPSGEIFSVAIAGKDGACVDAFGCTNGVFYPEDPRKVSSHLDAFKAVVVGNFPEKPKAPERR